MPNAHSRITGKIITPTINVRSAVISTQITFLLFAEFAFAECGQARSDKEVIAALFVQTDGTYFGLPDVDPWDKERDARKYVGPHAVVAHPPCERWSQMNNVNAARWGYTLGEDDGCFASALAAVRKWGGYWSIRRKAALSQPSGFLARTERGAKPFSAIGFAKSIRRPTGTEQQNARGCFLVVRRCLRRSFTRRQGARIRSEDLTPHSLSSQKKREPLPLLCFAMHCSRSQGT